jgi:hypothetical protein
VCSGSGTLERHARSFGGVKAASAGGAVAQCADADNEAGGEVEVIWRSGLEDVIARGRGEESRCLKYNI